MNKPEKKTYFARILMEEGQLWGMQAESPEEALEKFKTKLHEGWFIKTKWAESHEELLELEDIEE